MRLTPLDIRKQEFRKVMRGYDPLEVEAFLDMVADEYDDLLEKRKEYSDRLKQLEARVQDFEKMEQTLQSSLLEAQDAVSQSKSVGERHSGQVVREAEVEAQRILNDARNEVAALQREILTLKSQKASFAVRLRHILESQIEVIRVLELDDVDPGDVQPARKKVAASRPDSAAIEKVPTTGKPRQSDAAPAIKEQPAMARPDEPEDMDMINDTAPEDEAFSVIGAGGDEEQNLIEKMVLEIDEDIEPDDIEDPDLNAAVEEMARERKRQQRGLDEQE